MRYLIFTLLLIFPALALAQDKVDPAFECAAVLAAPPFVALLTRNEGRDFQEFSSLSSRRELLGLACSVDELTAFFENAGWEFLSYEERSPSGPLRGPSEENSIYFVDASVFYCQKRPTLFGIFDYRCRPSATISFHSGKISNLITSVSK